MALTVMPCGCPCIENPDPCGCASCPCITGVAIYSNISLNISGVGISKNIVYVGPDTQREVDYDFDYTNSIDSIISISNGGYSEFGCAEDCPSANFSADASTGFLSSDLDYTQTWELAAGVECPAGISGCTGYSTENPDTGGDCPQDTCLDTGQVLNITSNAGGGETDIRYSNCAYDDGEGVVDHIVEYACSNSFGPYPNSDTQFSAIFNICPSTNAFSLSIQFDDGNTQTKFSLSTLSSGGSQFGYALLNNDNTQYPLYIDYIGPAGMSSVNISGTAVIGIEFDINAVTRDPGTGECPQV